MKAIYTFLILLISFVSTTFAQNTSANTQLAVRNWCFQYKYDARKRITHKKIPGADWIYQVYDSRDRIVLTQDGNQRQTNTWTFTRYDELNRIVFTGLTDTTLTLSQQQMQSVVDKFYLSPSANYSSNSYPKIINPQKILTTNYYDDYSWLNSTPDSYKFSFNGQDLAGQVTSNFKRVSGLPTGKKLKVLDGAGGPATWLTTVLYYDDKQHVIQTISELYAGGVIRSTNIYDFKGKVVATRISIGNDYASKWFSFDHADRLKTITHQFKDGPKVIIASNDYNEVGQLTSKQIHSENGMSGKQNISYRYNIRGWTTAINNDLFATDLSYNKQPANGQSLYNGNVSTITWKNASKQNTFAYEYDPMNRIRLAKSASLSSPSFDQTSYQYDLNGNIIALTRLDKPGSKTDALSYDFGSGMLRSNRLIKVTDNADQSRGFADGISSGNDFSYDFNGNMTADQNKQLTIAYNELNLPACVVKSNVKLCFTYDASGKKLSQTLVGNGTTLNRIDYVDDFEYVNGSLKAIRTEEGRVVVSGSKAEYQYHLKDHLGNIRTTFTTIPQVTTSMASLEPDSVTKDQSSFLRYDLARKVQSALFDHTRGNNPKSNVGFSQRLNGSSNERIGLAKSVSVMPGDVVRAAVFAKYVDPKNANWKAPLVTLMNYLALPASAPAGIIRDGAGYSSSAATSLGVTAINHPVTTAAPKAYLNCIFINREFDPASIVESYVQIPETAYEDGSDRPHSKLELSRSITEPGYVYMYVSNDNPVPIDVFFDDLTVEHTMSPIVSFQDYDPFGVVFNSYERENSVPDRRKFQGQEHIADLGLNWDSFKWRNHQPEIGRFFNIDPLAEKYYHNSPYAFSENKVTIHVELEGLESVYVFDEATRPKDNGTAGTSYGANIYVLGLDGSVNGPYRGSSYPNSKSPTDNAPAGNTVNTGEHLYNNASGHKNGSKKGLNIVDESGNRVAPGTSPDGSNTTMTVVNVHQGYSDIGGYQSRGSNGCITIRPADAAGFFSNFDWSGPGGKTGNSSGTVTVYRGSDGASTMMQSNLEALKAIKEMLDQQHRNATNKP